MEQEEAIKYLRQIYPNGGHCWLDSQRIVAIEMAISALSQHSLPSNLEEAAEKYAKGEGLENALGGWEDMSDAFKAGAEWMAGQGACADAEICKLADRAWVTPLDEKLFQNEVYDKFKAGDKVVVQIRKK